MSSRYFRPKVLRLGHSTEVWVETRCATNAFKPRPTLKAFGSKESAPLLPIPPPPPPPHPTQRQGITGKNEKLVVAGCLLSNKRFSFVEKEPFTIFQKVTIRKTWCANILEKSLLEKLGFFYILSSWNRGRGNSPSSISRFVLFLHLIAKP